MNCTFAVNKIVFEIYPSIKILFFRKILIITLLVSLLHSCIDPIAPIFDFQSDIIIINALDSTAPGTTSVTVEKTKIEYSLKLYFFALSQIPSKKNGTLIVDVTRTVFFVIRFKSLILNKIKLVVIR